MSIQNIAVLAAVSYTAFAIDNGLGMTPQMGWNSWNSFACNINETMIHETVNAFMDQGFDQLGYEYINLDDCWQTEKRINGQV